MTTLGIFTVKKLLRASDGTYWTYGGFGEYLKSIRQYFDEVVLFAHVRADSPPSDHYPLDTTGLSVVPMPWYSSEAGALLSLPRMTWAAIRHARRLDVVHARLPDYTGVIGSLVSRAFGKPVFHQIVADWAVEADRIPLLRRRGLGVALKLHLKVYDWTERRTCAGQLVFAQGESCFVKHSHRATAFLVASSAHRADDIVAPKPTFAHPPFTILNVARLTSIKNQSLILRSLRLLNETSVKWRAVFVGGGPQRAALEQEALRLGVSDWVTFRGPVNHGTDLWALYDAADVFVLSSRSEGTPKVILEAMARGVPVVATNVSGIPTLVKHRESGLLVGDDDEVALSSALLELLANEGFRWSLQCAAHDTARARTVEAEMERMMKEVAARWPHLGLDPSGRPVRGRLE